MAINDVYEMSLKGTMAGQSVITTHHFRQLVADEAIGTPGGPPADLRAWWLDHGQGAWLDAMPVPNSVNGYTLDTIEIRLQEVYGVESMVAAVYAVGLAGLHDIVSGDHLPVWVVGHTAITTSRAGRRRRGRYFWSGLATQDVIEPDTLVTGEGYTKAQQVIYTSSDNLGYFLVGGDSPNWRLGVFSRRLAGFPAPRRRDGSPAAVVAPPAHASDAFTDAVSLAVGARASTLRSRRAR